MLTVSSFGGFRCRIRSNGADPPGDISAGASSAATSTRPGPGQLRCLAYNGCILARAVEVGNPETRYLVLPITKIFLALGGVFGPLADYGEPGKSIFLQLPASDLFFQVGHFCVKGEFYQISTLEWFLRIAFWIIVFFILNLAFFNFARKRHQSFGG